MATLGLFVKHPVPGTVKTRLGAEIGKERSCELYSAFLKDLFSMTQTLDAQRVLAYAPASEVSKDYFSACISSGAELWAQPELDLGNRLASFFEEYLPTHGPVVVIGSDSPTLTPNLIEQAFKALEGNDIVLGPAVDGGYYLVGQRVFVPKMFEQIDWSGPDVLQQTVAQLEHAGHSLELLTPWYDIDSLEDLHFLRGHLAALAASGSSCQEPVHTSEILKQIFSH